MSAAGITLAPSVVVDGVTWNLFSVDFDTDEGVFSTYIYAIDHGHAAMRLEDLRASARIGGQIAATRRAP